MQFSPMQLIVKTTLRQLIRPVSTNWKRKAKKRREKRTNKSQRRMPAWRNSENKSIG